MNRRTKLLNLAAISLFLLTGCKDGDEYVHHHSNKPFEEKVVKEDHEKVADETAIFFDINHLHHLSSEYNDFGETIISYEKISDSTYLAEGYYSSGVRFYRTYLIDDFEISLLNETTSENRKKFNDFDKEKDVISDSNKQILLKKPYEVGNKWDDGEITEIYVLDDTFFIEVTYVNGNRYIFKQGEGISSIFYSIPSEMVPFYRDSITEIEAFKKG